MFARLCAIAAAVMLAFPGLAAELVMVEQEGCIYCEQWNREIGPIYPKTSESRIAPLRRMDLFSGFPEEIEFTAPVNFTPTFVLVEDGREVARINGYPGEDFFWGLLDRMLSEHTNFEGGS